MILPAEGNWRDEAAGRIVSLSHGGLQLLRLLTPCRSLVTASRGLIAAARTVPVRIVTKRGRIAVTTEPVAHVAAMEAAEVSGHVTAAKVAASAEMAAAVTPASQGRSR